jgi:hypothetical protein
VVPVESFPENAPAQVKKVKVKTNDQRPQSVPKNVEQRLIHQNLIQTTQPMN